MNRLPRFNIEIPSRYKDADFRDVLDKLKTEFGMKVKGGMIEMRMYNKSFEIERFGKKFFVSIMAFGGDVNITITDNESSI